MSAVAITDTVRYIQGGVQLLASLGLSAARIAEVLRDIEAAHAEGRELTDEQLAGYAARATEAVDKL